VVIASRGGRVLGVLLLGGAALGQMGVVAVTVCAGRRCRALAGTTHW